MPANHGAAGPSAGTLWQNQRLLMALLDADDPDAAVGLEITNDLVVLDTGGVVTTSIQNKHSLNDGSLSPRSRTWWESAPVFLDLLVDQSTSANTTFVIATTFDVPTGSPFHPFASGTPTPEDVNRLLAEIDAIASAKPNQDYLAAYVAWEAASHADKKDLLHRLRVQGGLAPVTGAQKEVVSALLARSFHNHTVAEAADELVGWIELEVRQKITSKGCAIKVRDIRTKLGQLRDKHSLSLLPRLIPEEYDVEAALASKEVYLRQLLLIEASGDDLALSVQTFGEANRHRLWWFDSGLLGDDRIEQFDRLLTQQWTAAKGEHQSVAPEIDRGKRIYYQCLKVKARLGPVEPDFDIICGSYHVLSQRRSIGWHPRFMELLSEGDVK